MSVEYSLKVQIRGGCPFLVSENDKNINYTLGALRYRIHNCKVRHVPYYVTNSFFKDNVYPFPLPDAHIFTIVARECGEYKEYKNDSLYYNFDE